MTTQCRNPCTFAGTIERRLPPERFVHTWRTLGASHLWAFRWLARRYAEPHRAYHNAEHIAECLAWLEQLEEFAERPDELAVAIYFHDAIYKPAAPDNEQNSAQRFRTLAVRAGVRMDAIERIATLIASTSHHASEHGDAALLSDIDLAILGASPLRYGRYERAIRREYANVSDLSYRAGRSRVLGGFLERVCIYRTRRLGDRLEAQARANLGRALNALQTP